MSENIQPTGRVPPKAVLVGVQLPGVSDQDHHASLEELARLCTTLGFQVIAKVSQKRNSPVTATVVGDGKLREIAAWTGGSGRVASRAPARRSKAHHRDDQPEEDFVDAVALDDRSLGEDDYDDSADLPAEKADKVVFDHELTPNQLRNLETATDVEVLDRTGVIVEIFHRHARTREARIQVEIARLKYLAPRLRQSRTGGDRQGGGIGAKGVGETAHELDKRRIRDRIAELNAELTEIHRSQEGRRDRRRSQAKVALVGYTNAGKSSLMRALTGSEVLVEDKLFATLDTTVRAMQPEGVPRVLVSDTVGFIKKLPHDLVASFRSTLDEALDASLLLYVVDASDPTFRSQLQVTREVLAEIGADGQESRLVLNKMDRVSHEAARQLQVEFPEGIFLSTRNVQDVSRLKELIRTFFEHDMTETDLEIPYERGDLVGEVHRTMRVLSETHSDSGTTLRVRADAGVLAKFREKL